MVEELTEVAYGLDGGCKEREGSRMISTRPQVTQGLEICLIYLHIFNDNDNTLPCLKKKKKVRFGIR